MLFKLIVTEALTSSMSSLSPQLLGHLKEGLHHHTVTVPLLLTWDQLPDHLLIRMYHYCDIIALLRLRRLCRSWSRVSQSTHAWTHVLYATTQHSKQLLHHRAPSLQFVSTWTLEAGDLSPLIFQTLTKTCPHLASLTIAPSPSLTDKSLAVLSHFHGLRSLLIHPLWKDRITSRGLISLARCTSLTSLDIRVTTHLPITDSVIAAWVTLPALRELRLRGCQQLTDLAMICLKSCATLDTLALVGVKQITELGLKALSQSATLRYLSLAIYSATSSFSLSALEQFAACPSLRSLSLPNSSFPARDVSSLRATLSRQVKPSDEDPEPELQNPIPIPIVLEVFGDVINGSAYHCSATPAPIPFFF